MKGISSKLNVVLSGGLNYNEFTNYVINERYERPPYALSEDAGGGCGSKNEPVGMGNLWKKSLRA